MSDITKQIDHVASKCNDAVFAADTFSEEVSDLSSKMAALVRSAEDAEQEINAASDAMADLCDEIDELEQTILERDEEIEELKEMLKKVGNEQLVERLKKMEAICRGMWLDIEDAKLEGEHNV